MELFDKLAKIFELDSINIDKANRRTLLKYAVRTDFQKRREVFYSICKLINTYFTFCTSGLVFTDINFIKVFFRINYCLSWCSKI